MDIKVGDYVHCSYGLGRVISISENGLHTIHIHTYGRVHLTLDKITKA